jgi:hypothetical protein
MLVWLILAASEVLLVMLGLGLYRSAVDPLGFTLVGRANGSAGYGGRGASRGSGFPSR